jgi:hypothetical protein
MRPVAGTAEPPNEINGPTGVKPPAILAQPKHRARRRYATDQRDIAPEGVLSGLSQASPRHNCGDNQHDYASGS